MTTLWTLLFVPVAAQAAGGAGDEAKLPPIRDRLATRPIIRAEAEKDGGGGEKKSARLLGAKDLNDPLKALNTPELLKKHFEEYDEWIRQNAGQLGDSIRKGHPLYDLAVEDPVKFNVLLYELARAMDDRGQDRAYVTAIQAMRNDPAFREWITTYAAEYAQSLGEDETPHKTAANLKDVSYKDVTERLLGSGDDDLVKAAAELVGIEDEDRDLVTRLAGTATLSDEDEGEISIDPEPQGLRDYFDEKVKQIKRALERAIEQAGQSSSGGSDVKVEVSEKDRIPEETLPTTSELWTFSALTKGTQELHTVALAREYARYAAEIAHHRARASLQKMIDGSTDRPRRAFEILLAGLLAQHQQLSTLSAAATPAAAQLRSALSSAATEQAARLMAAQADRALARHVREESRAPRGYGEFRRAGIDDRGRERTDYKAGENFKNSGNDGFETPLQQRMAQSARGLSVGRESGSSGSGGGGFGGGGIRVVCEWDDQKKKVVCRIELPGSIGN